MPTDASQHVPVLLHEVLEWLAPREGQTFVDGTLGGGGHTRALAAAVGPMGRILALDRDPAAVAAAQSSLAGSNVWPVEANFCDLPDVMRQMEMESVDGILLDLGLSSDQLADAARGFSFDAEGDLDLRFNTNHGEPAWRLVERLNAERLADVIYQYGEERHSRRIARNLVEQRREQPIRTARQLAAVVRRSVPRSAKRPRIDPATRTFQALRIAVNDELGSLERAVQRLPECLREGGRMAVISFHSLEDRIVKCKFRDDPRLQVLTRKPIRPGDEELARNPRARSARMRVAARIALNQ